MPPQDKKAQIREVHHNHVTGLTADGLERSVLHAVLAVIRSDLVVYITSIYQSSRRCAVTVFVKTQHDYTAPGKLHGVCRAGLVVILVAVQQQYAGRRMLRRRRYRGIELVKEIPYVRFDPAFGDVDAAAPVLDAVGRDHAAENCRKKHREGVV